MYKTVGCPSKIINVQSIYIRMNKFNTLILQNIHISVSELPDVSWNPNKGIDIEILSRRFPLQYTL